jgi:SpoVK/Ycf46/Vps4 family AAA+-type ATPase
MDAHLYVGLPDAAARAAIAAEHLAHVPHEGAALAPDAVATATAGYSGAEVVGVLRDASLRAVADALKSGTPVALRETHLADALAAAPRQVTTQSLAIYEKWRAPS